MVDKKLHKGYQMKLWESVDGFKKEFDGKFSVTGGASTIKSGQNFETRCIQFLKAFHDNWWCDGEHCWQLNQCWWKTIWGWSSRVMMQQCQWIVGSSHIVQTLAGTQQIFMHCKLSGDQILAEKYREAAPGRQEIFLHFFGEEKNLD